MLALGALKDNTVVSLDQKGVAEYWDATTGAQPAEQHCGFRLRSATDLFALAKARDEPSSVAVAADGSRWAATAASGRAYVFATHGAKLLHTFDEGLARCSATQRDGPDELVLDELDFGRRIAAERAIRSGEGNEDGQCADSVAFDASGSLLLMTTMLGVKVFNLGAGGRLERTIGLVENTDRFMAVSLFQGVVELDAKEKQEVEAGVTEIADPTLAVASYGRNRFFLFSPREPAEDAEGRDVFNEKPSKSEQMVAAAAAKTMGTGGGADDDLPGNARRATLHTTLGDVVLDLYPDKCPRTVENFVTHARDGYYDRTTFHRVIKDFMVQGGDPAGNGTGGESIWGGTFADEFAPGLDHSKPFTLSMANAGPGTNGSQFFITTVPTPWLDGKHTVFGRVATGRHVVLNMTKQPANPKNDKPYTDIEILSITT